ncbi:MAG: PQQ-dependent sugar dehydrogenase, partial [Pirellulaceae bacterium]
FSNHNGGPMTFGNDGLLYIGMGDGGGRNDPTGEGQDLSSWMGSILRIDVDKPTAARRYSIPADNPFVDVKGAKPEIYAYGIRNPWRIANDPETGTIWIGDVGQDQWEEVNILEKGANYGWSAREGSYQFGNAPVDPKLEVTDPIFEYDHQIGKSITGGYVYRGKEIPELQGAYLYADYISGRIWALKYDLKNKRVVSNIEIKASGTPVMAFGLGVDGEIYYTVGAASGRCIYKFERP